MEHTALIVNFTPTGMLPTREQTQLVPISPPEIIDDVLAAHELGITMAHLHVRDRQTGIPDYRPELYAEIIAGIRRHAPELILCVSLSGRKFIDFEQRAAVLELDGDLKPDMGSLTLSSLNFNREASVNSPEMILKLVRKMNAKGIKPELEAFDSGMLNYAKYLIARGYLKAPHYFNLILGNVACAQADLLHIGVMINDLPTEAIWSLGGIGNFQLRVNSLAVVMGGGVRIGLEDNIWFDQARTVPAGNLDLLKRIKIIAAVHERDIMSPAELRRRLKLQPGRGLYGVVPEPAK